MARARGALYQNAWMARNPKTPGPRKPAEPPLDTGLALKAELRRRGMTDAEIDAATRKKKRRKILEFEVVKSRHLMPHDINRPLNKPPRAQASDELCTVEFAAQRLKLHPKTILRFIHEGRLKGTRIGKSYRIPRADLEAFAGLPAPAEAPVPEAWVTSIVDVPGIGPDLARRWQTTVTGAVHARPPGPQTLRADVIYEPERSHLKIVIVGPPDDTVSLLSLIRIWLEQLEA